MPLTWLTRPSASGQHPAVFLPASTDAGRLRSQSQLATSVTQSGQLLPQHLVPWPVAHHPRNKVIRNRCGRCLVTASLPAAASNYLDVRARRQLR